MVGLEERQGFRPRPPPGRRPGRPNQGPQRPPIGGGRRRPPLNLAIQQQLDQERELQRQLQQQLLPQLQQQQQQKPDPKPTHPDISLIPLQPLEVCSYAFCLSFCVCFSVYCFLFAILFVPVFLLSLYLFNYLLIELL